MKRKTIVLTISMFLIGFFVVQPAIVMASGHDSGMKKGSPGHIEEGKQKQMKGSPSKKDDTETALSGYCPVCLLDDALVEGKSNFVTEYKGKVYRFAGFEQQKKFLDDPEKYIQGAKKKLNELINKVKKGTYKGSGGYKGSH